MWGRVLGAALGMTLGGGCAVERTGAAPEQPPHEHGIHDSGDADTPTGDIRDASRDVDAAAHADAALDGNSDDGGDAAKGGDAADDGGDVRVDASPPRSPCDLSGRWLIAMRYVTNALGGDQHIYRWLYYELAGSGGSFAVTKGLLCGDGAAGAGAVIAQTDFEPSWAPSMKKTDYTGRALTSTPTTGGCAVTMEKWYTVQGATLPYYLDPNVTLPRNSEPASETRPGWEDWDEDGKPGITGQISGSIGSFSFSGKVFCAPRRWTQIADTVPSVSKSFIAHMTWGLTQNVMSAEGAGLLGDTEVVPALDPELHIAEFVRLSPDQAAGPDDAAICAAVRELAPTLAPTAAAQP